VVVVDSDPGLLDGVGKALRARHPYVKRKVSAWVAGDAREITARLEEVRVRASERAERPLPALQPAVCLFDIWDQYGDYDAAFGRLLLAGEYNVWGWGQSKVDYK
jgi:hypothetical protein